MFKSPIFLDRESFINLPNGSIVYNRLGFMNCLWSPTPYVKEELRRGVGLWSQIGWKDNQYIEVPIEYVKEVPVKRYSQVEYELRWKDKGLNSKKANKFRHFIKELCESNNLTY